MKIILFFLVFLFLCTTISLYYYYFLSTTNVLLNILESENEYIGVSEHITRLPKVKFKITIVS